MNSIQASQNSNKTSNSLSGNGNTGRQAGYSNYSAISSGSNTQGNLNNTSLTGTQTVSPAANVPTGQILTGEVIDIKRNEVSIKLPNKDIITVPYKGTSELKMGQRITFQVIIDQNNHPGLELMNTTSSPLKSTIMEALEAAGLPKTDSNQEIVRELLNHQMSIDKQSIQDIFRASLVHKDTSISTLVLMTKHNIPINETSGKQFENYRNYEHRVVKEVEQITNILPNLMDDLGRMGSADKMAAFNEQILQILLADDTKTDNTTVPSTLSLTNKETQELLLLLEKYPLDTSLRADIVDQKADFMDVVTTLYKDFELAVKADENILESLMADGEVDPSRLNLNQDAFKVPLINEIMERFSSYQYESGQVGAFLSLENRNDLLHQLQSIPLSREIKQTILSGTITTKEILSFIKDYLPLMDEKLMNRIFTSKSYKNILKEHLLSKWTLTPDSLGKENTVPSLYERMYKQLSELEELTTNLNKTLEDLSTNTSAHKLENDITATKQNLDFMKTLNELFTYVQLPLHLRNKTVHSELYVYTNKKELKKNKNNVSALLHLDMDHLGSMDIHVTLNYNQILAKFYLETDDSIQLVNEHIDELGELLIRKGFLVHSEILKKEKEIDIVKDFIEKEPQISSLKRYSFDIRA